MITEQARTAHHTSAAGVADRALGVLNDAGGTGTVAAAHLAHAAEQPGGSLPVALGALRMLGADVLAPYLLTGRPAPPDEVTAVGLALSALPPADPPPPAPPEGPEPAWVRAWLDWGLVTALAQTGAAAALAPPPMPPGPPPCDHHVGERRRPATDGGRTAALPPADGGTPDEPPPTLQASRTRQKPQSPQTRQSPQADWQRWGELMGQLSSLALPGLDSPVHDAARAGARSLARGATRGTLRRDFPTAARITRWLAWLHADGVPLPLDPAPLTAHLGMLGGGERLTLDIAVARHLLGLEPL